MTSNKWTLVTLATGTTPPSARSGHSAVLYGKAVIYVFGGDATDNNTYKYEILFKKWTQVTTSGTTPPARISHSAVVHSGSMYVFGGVTNDNNTYKLNLTSNEWTQLSTTGTTPPSARIGHSAVVYNNSMYIFER